MTDDERRGRNDGSPSGAPRPVRSPDPVGGERPNERQDRHSRPEERGEKGESLASPPGLRGQKQRGYQPSVERRSDVPQSLEHVVREMEAEGHPVMLLLDQASQPKAIVNPNQHLTVPAQNDQTGSDKHNKMQEQYAGLALEIGAHFASLWS